MTCEFVFNPIALCLSVFYFIRLDLQKSRESDPPVHNFSS